MATEVKFRRGTTAEHQNFIGAEGEITVDITKWIPVVHEGGTGIPPGGTTNQVLMKLSNADGDADWQDENNNVDGGYF